MVYFMTPNSHHLTSYGYRKLGRVAEFEKIWTDLTFQHKSGSWQNFVMTSPESLYMKNVVNEHSFIPVAHTAYYDTRLGCYGFLKTK
jgi:hypothetical protein